MVREWVITYLQMVAHWGHNPFTNHFPTFWDIQVHTPTPRFHMDFPHTPRYIHRSTRRVSGREFRECNKQKGAQPPEWLVKTKSPGFALNIMENSIVLKTTRKKKWGWLFGGVKKTNWMMDIGYLCFWVFCSTTFLCFTLTTSNQIWPYLL